MSRSEFEGQPAPQHPHCRRRRGCFPRLAFKAALIILVAYLARKAYLSSSMEYQDQIRKYQTLLDQTIQNQQKIQKEYSNVLSQFQALVDSIEYEAKTQGQSSESKIKISKEHLGAKKYTDKVVYIKNSEDLYLSSTPDGDIESRNWGRAWEEWTLIYLGNNQYAIQDVWNNYLTFKSGHNKYTHSDSADSLASRWIIENVSDGRDGLFWIKNAYTNKYLLAPKERNVVHLNNVHLSKEAFAEASKPRFSNNAVSNSSEFKEIWNLVVKV